MEATEVNAYQDGSPMSDEDMDDEVGEELKDCQAELEKCQQLLARQDDDGWEYAVDAALERCQEQLRTCENEKEISQDLCEDLSESYKGIREDNQKIRREKESLQQHLFMLRKAGAAKLAALERKSQDDLRRSTEENQSLRKLLLVYEQELEEMQNKLDKGMERLELQAAVYFNKHEGKDGVAAKQRLYERMKALQEYYQKTEGLIEDGARLAEDWENRHSAGLWRAKYTAELENTKLEYEEQVAALQATCEEEIKRLTDVNDKLLADYADVCKVTGYGQPCGQDE